MIKKYRKKGTDKATHQMSCDKYKTVFHDLQNKTVRIFINDDSSPTFTGKLEGKLHFGEKVDSALENVKQQVNEFYKLHTRRKFIEDANNPESNYFVGLYTLLHRAAQELVNAIEDLRADEASKDAKSSDVDDINVASKNDVKLPEVGKRYRQKSSKQKFKVSKIEGDYITVRDYDSNKQTVRLRDFWINYEELPEDNIEKPKTSVQKAYDKAELVKPKSIWKDVSELPRRDSIVFVNIDNMYSMPAKWDGEDFICLEDKRPYKYKVKEWLYPSDLIKIIINTEERLRKLEGK